MNMLKPICCTCLFIVCLFFTACSSSNALPESSSTAVGVANHKEPTCFDTEYKFIKSGQDPWVQSYEQYYGQGKSPVPEAEACNSDSGRIADVFPDQYLAKCIAVALDLSTEHQISQYLLDQIVQIHISGLTGTSENEITEGELSARSIGSISGLELLRNLRIIGLSLNKVTDVSQLSAMPFLMDVDLRGTPVSDLTPLLELEKLQVLYIDKSSENAKGFYELKTKGIITHN